ncbi:hypothetical protein AQUCO_02200183v1 [Aquilegia coerulea]|uniref:Uncharacterized protein n=1 Tax=Aquilegia coerulea TaxID=218851 RepID=A0A2G5DDI0_AQUCA|nr:hypothetical protein AQUCO_02200183v1 [Aquilegia coerulea]
MAQVFLDIVLLGGHVWIMNTCQLVMVLSPVMHLMLSRNHWEVYLSDMYLSMVEAPMQSTGSNGRCAILLESKYLLLLHKLFMKWELLLLKLILKWVLLLLKLILKWHSSLILLQ